MLLQPSQVHHFDDIGYRHGTFYQCPANAPGGQLPESKALGIATSIKGNPEEPGGVGCRCQCDRRPAGVRNYSGYCFDRLEQPSNSERPWVELLIFDESMQLYRIVLLGFILSCALLATRIVPRRWYTRVGQQ